MSSAALTLFLSLAVGCAVHKPDTFRLVKQNSATILVPPGVANPDVDLRTFQPGIARGPAKCAYTDVITLQTRGKALRITMSRQALAAEHVGWLKEWVATAEAKGCIAPGYSTELATRILDAVPLEPAVRWRLLNFNDVRAGYVDLAAGNRLQVDSPIFREGTPPGASAIESAVATAGAGNSINVDLKASPNLIGYERSWYALRRIPGRAGFAVEPLSAERHVDGRTESSPAPATNLFRFDPGLTYYRLLYRADRTIVLFGTTSRLDLERLSREMTTDTSACEALAGHSCAVVPATVGVNPEIVVTVNGQERLLPVGSNVTAAIRSAGARPEDVLPRLTLQHPYAGRLVPMLFDRAAPDILTFRLAGGEVLSW